MSGSPVINDEQLARLREFAVNHALKQDPVFKEIANAEDLLKSADLPAREDQIIQVALLAAVAENILEAIPPDVMERQAWFKPKLEVPSKEDLVCDPARIPELLDGLLSRVEWKKVFAEDQAALETLKETIPYIVDLNAQAFRGTTGPGDKSDLEVIQRSLHQCGKIVALLMPPLGRALAAIPVPDEPVDLNANVGELSHRDKYAQRLSKAIGLGVRTAIGFTIATIALGLQYAGAGLMALGAGLYWCGEKFAHGCVAVGKPCIAGLGATGAFLGGLFMGACRGIGSLLPAPAQNILGACAKPFVWSWNTGVDLAKRAFWGTVAGGKWCLRKLYDGACATLRAGRKAGTAVAIPVYSGLSWATEKCAQGLKAVFSGLGYGARVTAATGVTCLWSVGAGIKRCAELFVDGLKAGLRTLKPWTWPGLRRWGDSIKAFLSKEFHWFDILNFKRHFSGVRLSQGEKLAVVDSRDPNFTNKISVVQVLGVASSNGRLYPVQDLLAPRLARKPELIDKLFPTKRFDEPFPGKHPETGETFINIAVPPKARGAMLPLPMGYEITGIRFTDKEGNILPMAGTDVHRCVFGSAQVRVPENTHRVEYRAQACQVQFTKNELNQIVNALGAFPAFMGVEGEAFREALDCLPVTADERTDLLFAHQASRGFVYTNDRFVHNLLRYSGGSISEMVGGLRMGTSDPLAMFLAVMYQQHGVPAVVVSGFAPHNHTFALERVHAQTGVLSEGKVQTYDLCSRCENKKIMTENMTMYQQVQMLSQLKTLTNEELFYLGGNLHDLLLKEEKDGFFASIGKGIRRTLKKVKQLFESNYGSVNLAEELTQESGLELHKHPCGRVATVLAARIAMEKHIQRDLGRKSVQGVFDFVGRMPQMPRVAPEDFHMIAATRYPDTASYSIRERFHHFCKQALEDPQFEAAEKQRVLESAQKRLPGALAVERLAHSPSDANAIKGIDNVKEMGPLGPLSLEEACEIFNQKSVSVLGNAYQIDDVLYSMIGLGFKGGQEPARLIEDRSAWVRARRPETVALYCQRLFEIASVRAANHELIEPMDQGDMTRILAILGAGVSDAAKRTPEGSEARAVLEGALRTIGQTISVLNRASKETGIDQIEKDLFTGSYNAVRGWSEMAERLGFPALLEKIDRQYLRHTASLIEKRFDRRWSGLGDGQEMDRALTLLCENGLDFRQYLDHTAIYANCKTQLSHMKYFDKYFFNYPSLDNPASFLFSELANTDASKYYRMLQVLVKHGIFAEEDTQAAWPEVNERKVLIRLRQGLNMRLDKDGVSMTPNEELGARKWLRVTELPVLAEPMLGDDPRLKAILEYNRSRRGEHWAERALELIKQRFPEQWKTFTTESYQTELAMTHGLLKDLYQGAAPREAYRGLIWFAAHCAAGEERALCSGARAAARGLDPLAGKSEPGADAREILSGLDYQPPEELSPSLEGLTPDLLAASVFAGALLRASEVSMRERKNVKYDEDGNTIPLSTASYEGAKAFFTEDMSIDQRLQLVATSDAAYPADPRVPLNAVWDKLFKRDPLNGVDLTPLGNAAARGATLILQRMKDPWPKFVYSRNGRVIVNSRAGDFRELQEFAPGDEIKRIDWRASGKSDKLYVRNNQEDEQRDITLVYDLNLLNQGLATWLNVRAAKAAEKPDQPYPYDPDDYKPRALMDLLTLLEFAAKEDRTVNIVLYGRSMVRHFKGVVESSGGAGPALYDRDEFLKKLAEPLMAAQDVYSREERLFGRQGYPPINVFEGGSLPYDPGKIFVFGVSAKNFEKSAGVYRSLQRQGRLVAQLRKPKEGK